MWRQTDDTKIWYEWLVEAFAWVGPSQRIRIGSSVSLWKTVLAFKTPPRMATRRYVS